MWIYGTIVAAFSDIVMKRDFGTVHHTTVDEALAKIGKAQTDVISAFKAAYSLKFKESYECSYGGKDCLGFSADVQSLYKSLRSIDPNELDFVVSNYLVKAIDCVNSLNQKLSQHQKANKDDFVEAGTSAIASCKLNSLK